MSHTVVFPWEIIVRVSFLPSWVYTALVKDESIYPLTVMQTINTAIAVSDTAEQNSSFRFTNKRTNTREINSKASIIPVPGYLSEKVIFLISESLVHISVSKSQTRISRKAINDETGGIKLNTKANIPRIIMRLIKGDTTTVRRIPINDISKKYSHIIGSENITAKTPDIKVKTTETSANRSFFGIVLTLGIRCIIEVNGLLITSILSMVKNDSASPMSQTAPGDTAQIIATERNNAVRESYSRPVRTDT